MEKKKREKRENHLPRVWFIRWEDNTLAVGGTDYEKAVKIAKSKNMKYVIV